MRTNPARVPLVSTLQSFTSATSRRSTGSRSRTWRVVTSSKTRERRHPRPTAPLQYLYCTPAVDCRCDRPSAHRPARRQPVLPAHRPALRERLGDPGLQPKLRVVRRGVPGSEKAAYCQTGTNERSSAEQSPFRAAATGSET